MTKPKSFRRDFFSLKGQSHEIFRANCCIPGLMIGLCSTMG
jgi:hypothetical protein